MVEKAAYASPNYVDVIPQQGRAERSFLSRYPPQSDLLEAMRYTFVYRIFLCILSPALATAGQVLAAIPVLPFAFGIER
jgi:hypothetical protein